MPRFQFSILLTICCAIMHLTTGGSTICATQTTTVADQTTANENQESKFKLIGIATIGGDQTDLSGETDELAPGVPGGIFGGISGLEFDQASGRYLAISDRGPQDGAIDFHCRFHEVEIQMDPELPVSMTDSEASSIASLTAKLTNTTILHDENKRHFTGLASAFSEDENQAGRFDPEAIRRLNNGNVLISDEYGPHLIEFDNAGTVIKRHAVQESLKVAVPGIDKATENAANQTGRACNRGMEGLEVSADGKFAFGLMQSALLQDAEFSSGKPKGFHCRLIKLNLEDGTRNEYVYVLEDPGFKVHEIVQETPDTFLVLENCGGIGEASVCKKVVRITLAGATDVTAIASLPHDKLPDGVRPATKETVIDLLDSSFGIPVAEIPEKIEGLTFGPDVEGKKSLIIASDNDFMLEQPTRFYVFRQNN